MEEIRLVCKSPECVCTGLCCQDCMKQADCSGKCSRIVYRDAVYSSNAFLVRQMEELARSSGHWLIQVAAQRLGAMDILLESHDLKVLRVSR